MTKFIAVFDKLLALLIASSEISLAEYFFYGYFKAKLWEIFPLPHPTSRIEIIDLFFEITLRDCSSKITLVRFLLKTAMKIIKVKDSYYYKC